MRSSHRGSVALIDATAAGYKRGPSQSNLYEAQTFLPNHQYSLPSLLKALSSFRERERGSDRVYTKMATEFSKGKTLVILAIVIGCFAILWPKIFYPMFQGPVAPTTIQQQPPVKERDPSGMYRFFKFCVCYIYISVPPTLIKIDAMQSKSGSHRNPAIMDQTCGMFKCCLISCERMGSIALIHLSLP